MNKLSSLRPEQKYRLALFSLLALSSTLSIGLFAIRSSNSESDRYAFLVWNLFLAWIPFGFAWVAYTSTHLPKFLMILLVGGCAILWLLFFPNALYILTDFQHLSQLNSEAPVWYDVIMLIWFAWSGLFLGLISLYFMQRIVGRWLGTAASWVFVVAVTVISSLGIYAGRFMRWNSWDVLFTPLKVTHRIIVSVSQTEQRTLIFSILFALFFLFVYVTIFVFAQLINQQNPRD